MNELLTMESAHKMFLNIFYGGNEKMADRILPMQGNLFRPKDDGLSTVIGYQLAHIQPRVTGGGRDNVVTQPVPNVDGVRAIYRLCEMSVHLLALGQYAEHIMRSTLFWDLRRDVKEQFNHYGAELNNNARMVHSLIYEGNGENDEIAWETDLKLTVWIWDEYEEITWYRYLTGSGIDI